MLMRAPSPNEPGIVHCHDLTSVSMRPVKISVYVCERFTAAGFSKKFQVENIIFFIFKFGLTQDKKSGNKILIL